MSGVQAVFGVIAAIVVVGCALAEAVNRVSRVSFFEALALARYDPAAAPYTSGLSTHVQMLALLDENRGARRESSVWTASVDIRRPVPSPAQL